ncbi:MAG: FxLYD domain-containing protein [Carboxylicivirga sp.]|jgi:uncharacterized protein (TIGR02588 family)|nr:FxLYD domain-containing protein [Carboxylicivirga sp.]
MKRSLILLFLISLLTSCEEIIEMSFNAKCEVVHVSDPWVANDGTAYVKVKIENTGSNKAEAVSIDAVLYCNGNEIDDAYKNIGDLRANKSATVTLEFRHHYNYDFGSEYDVTATVRYNDREIFPEDDEEDYW